MREPDELDALVEIEGEIHARITTLQEHHRALQELDYETDPKVLRPYLDMWMDWHMWAAYWLVEAKRQRASARAAYNEAWQKVVHNTRDVDVARVLTFYQAYEERKVYYERKIEHRRRAVDVLDSLVDTVYEFLRSLKDMSTHWDKRRVDTKWELDRMSELPGSDYES